MKMSIKEQFREYLANCVQTRRQTGNTFIIGRTTVDSYVSFVEVDKPGTTLYVSTGDSFAGYIVISDE